MRYLDFSVTGQALKKPPTSDFSGIVAGSRNYLVTRFTFDHMWDGCKKIVLFSSNGVDLYPVPLVNNKCTVPAEVLNGAHFHVSVVGKAPNDMRLTTNKYTICQEV